MGHGGARPRDPPRRFIADSSLMNALSDRFRESLSGKYLFAEKLGEGATAEVYAARDVATGNEVAVKVLRREVAAEVGAERFVREIQVVGTLAHPNIVPLLASGTADGVPFHVMPRVRGESLRARVRREKQLPLADVVAIARQVADALDSAHAVGIVHRDIKPEYGSQCRAGQRVRLRRGAGPARAWHGSAYSPLTRACTSLPF